MPANIAHLLICNKSVKALEDGGGYEKFIRLLDSDPCKPYLNLGSIGPDLSYYGSKWQGIKSFLFDQSEKPLGVDGWSYLLHSKEPNRFPLTLIELSWKDTHWEEQKWKDEDPFKFAFACGFLSHMAADQILHCKINDIAGPYYRRGENRKIHRECEVYQDIALFHKLYPNEDFMDKTFHLWVNLVPDSIHNAPDWFRYFLQRAFVESHGVYPEEREIENWVDGLLFILRGVKLLGPYKSAYEELQSEGLGSEKFQRYFSDFYMDLFFQAVELTGFYWRMVFELYNPPGNVLQISEKMRERFLRVVQNADLSSALQKDVLGDAKKEFYSEVPQKLSALVKASKKPLNQKKILEINPSDVGKFGR